MTHAPEGSQNRSLFYNFYKAVNSISSGIYTTTVINTNFNNNRSGVYLSEVKFSTVILNDFDVAGTYGYNTEFIWTNALGLLLKTMNLKNK